MKRRNPRFGCPRIAQQISHAFGIEINKDVVRRVLAKHLHPDHRDTGPSWLTFIGHIKDSLWSVDLFRCESILLKSHWVMLVMDVFTRRIIGFGAALADIDSYRFAGCSMVLLPVIHRRSICPPTMIRCSHFTAGGPTCACSKSTKSRPCPWSRAGIVNLPPSRCDEAMNTSPCVTSRLASCSATFIDMPLASSALSAFS
jgi:hypothetical protein